MASDAPDEILPRHELLACLARVPLATCLPVWPGLTSVGATGRLLSVDATLNATPQAGTDQRLPRELVDRVVLLASDDAVLDFFPAELSSVDASVADGLGIGARQILAGLFGLGSVSEPDSGLDSAVDTVPNAAPVSDDSPADATMHPTESLPVEPRNDLQPVPQEAPPARKTAPPTPTRETMRTPAPRTTMALPTPSPQTPRTTPVPAKAPTLAAAAAALIVATPQSPANPSRGAAARKTKVQKQALRLLQGSGARKGGGNVSAAARGRAIAQTSALALEILAAEDALASGVASDLFDAARGTLTAGAAARLARHVWSLADACGAWVSGSQSPLAAALEQIEVPSMRRLVGIVQRTMAAGEDVASAGLAAIHALNATLGLLECQVLALDKMAQPLVSETLLRTGVRAMRAAVEGSALEAVAQSMRRAAANAGADDAGENRAEAGALACAAADTLLRLEAAMGRDAGPVSDDFANELVAYGVSGVFATIGASRGALATPLTAALAPALQAHSVLCARLLWRVFAQIPGQRGAIVDEIVAGAWRVGTPEAGGEGVAGLVVQHWGVTLLAALVLGLGPAVTHAGAAADVSQQWASGGLLEAAVALRRLHDAGAGAIAALIGGLVTRATVSGTAGGREVEYRKALEVVVGDLCGVLQSPEWPSAPVAATVALNAAMRVLDDRGGARIDTASRSVAVDVLGALGPALLQAGAAWESFTDDQPCSFPLSAKDWSTTDEPAVAAIVERVWAHVETLAGAAGATEAGQDAGLCWATWWASGAFPADLAQLPETHGPVGQVLQAAFERATVAALGRGSRQGLEAAKIGAAIQTLCGARYGQGVAAVVARLAALLDSGSVALRSRALRVLGAMAALRPRALLRDDRIIALLEERFHDASTTVRDAAVELVFRLAASDRAAAQAFFGSLAAALDDPGLAVRKRAVRQLAQLYQSTLTVATDAAAMTDVCVRLLQRIAGDDEESVQELAVKCLGDMWFGGVSAAGSLAGSLADLAGGERVRVLSRVWVLKELAGSARHRGLFREGLNRVLLGRMDDAVPKYAVEESIECVLAGSDASPGSAGELAPGAAGGQPVRSFALLVELARAHPRLLVPHVATLVPYATPEPGQALQAYLSALEILRLLLPLCDEEDVPDRVLCDLQASLVRQIPQCTIATAPFVAGLLAVLVAEHTLDWRLVCKVLVQCHGQLRGFVAGARVCSGQTAAQLLGARLVILGQLAQSVGFDAAPFRASLTEKFPETASAVAASFPGGAVGPALLELFADCVAHGVIPLECRAAAVQAAGLVWLGSPATLRENASQQMVERVIVAAAPLASALEAGVAQSVVDAPLPSPEESQLLVTLLNALEAVLDREDVGEHQFGAAPAGGGDAGAAAAVLQRHIGRICACALLPPARPNAAALAAAALKVLRTCVDQGLAHPLAVLPTLVALDRAPSQATRARAARLHRHLAQRHASFIHQRPLDCVQRSYAYGLLLGNASGAETPLGTLYLILRERRARRDAFLAALVRQFDGPFGHGLLRFVAENLAELPYRTVDEVAVVVGHACRLLAGPGVAAADARDPQRSLAFHMLLHVKRYLCVTFEVSEARSVAAVDAAGRTRRRSAPERPLAGPPDKAFSWTGLPAASLDTFEDGDCADICDSYAAALEADTLAGGTSGDADPDESRGADPEECDDETENRAEPVAVVFGGGSKRRGVPAVPASATRKRRCTLGSLPASNDSLAG